MDETTGVTAGAVDAIDFTWTPGRCFLANLVIGAGATTSAIAVLVAVGSLTSGRSPAVFVGQMAIMWVVSVPMFAGFSVLLTRRYPPILRFGAAPRAQSVGPGERPADRQPVARRATIARVA